METFSKGNIMTGNATIFRRTFLTPHYLGSIQVDKWVHRNIVFKVSGHIGPY